MKKVMQNSTLTLLTLLLMAFSAFHLSGVTAHAMSMSEASKLTLKPGRTASCTRTSTSEYCYYYKIIVPEDGTFYIECTSNETYQICTAVYSINNLNKPIVSKRSSYVTTTLSLTKGTYYVKVYDYYMKNSARHKIVFSQYTAYPNDETFDSSASNPSILTVGKAFRGSLTSNNKEDYCQIHIAKAGNYIFNVDNMLNGNLDFVVYSKSTSKRICSFGGLYTSKMGKYTLEPGDYLIHLYRGGDYRLFGRYSVKVTQAACDHSYTSRNISSSYFTKGYTLYTCKICGKSYKSNYTALKKMSLNSNYSATNTSLSVSWKKVSGASAYQIYCSTDKNMKSGVKRITVNAKTNVKINGLQSNKTYYIQIRPCIKKDSKITSSGSWSNKKSCKTKAKK